VSQGDAELRCRHGSPSVPSTTVREGASRPSGQGRLSPRIPSSFLAAFYAALIVVFAHPAVSLADAGDIVLHILQVEPDVITFDLAFGPKPVGKVMGALRDGVPTRIDYTLELWRRRSIWFDHMEGSAVIGLSVRYDPLADEYTLTSDEFPERSFGGTDALVLWLGAQGPIEFPLEQLMEFDERYYLAVAARIAPQSAEQVDAVEDWLEGDEEGRAERERRRIESGEGSGKRGGVRGFLFGFILNLSGLGDTTVNGQSEEFRPRGP